jgi:phage-related protein
MYNSTTKAIIFIGRSLDEIKAFPIEARREAGFQLDRVQRGYSPSDWKPMTVIGKGLNNERLTAFR